MKRKFLEDMGLEKDAIDKIMAENGSDIEAVKKDADKLQAEIDTYKQSLEDTKKELGKFKDMDIEGVQSKVKELETKYEEDTKALKTKLEQQAYEHATDKLLSGVEFTSNSAKEAIKKQIIEKGLKMEDGNILGADDLLKSQREKDPGAFKQVDDPNEPKPPSFNKSTKTGKENPPAGENQGLGSALASKFSK